MVTFRVRPGPKPEPETQLNVVEEPYLNVHQVAAKMQHVVKSKTIYGWARRAKNPMPAKPITNKVYLFLWSEVRQWIEAGGTLRRKV